MLHLASTCVQSSLALEEWDGIASNICETYMNEIQLTRKKTCSVIAS